MTSKTWLFVLVGAAAALVGEPLVKSSLAEASGTGYSVTGLKATPVDASHIGRFTVTSMGNTAILLNTETGETLRFCQGDERGSTPMWCTMNPSFEAIQGRTH